MSVSCVGVQEKIQIGNDLECGQKRCVKNKITKLQKTRPEKGFHETYKKLALQLT